MTGGGEENMEKKTVKFKRQQLYTEIWKIGLSKVSKQYAVPFQKLKEACEKANIPLPTQSYWSSLSVGKTMEKEALPESEEQEITINFSILVPADIAARKEAAANKKINEKAEPEETEEKLSDIPETINGEIVYRRKTLYKEVWSKPVTKIAQKYGVSDVMIHKICKSMAIPGPPRGYWARIAAGQKITKTPLPKFSGQDIKFGRRLSDVQEERKAAPAKDKDPLDFLGAEEREDVLNTAFGLKVTGDDHRLHTVLLKHDKMYKVWKKDSRRDENANWHNDYYRNTPEGEPVLWEHVSEQTLPRAYRILDCLFRAVESLGGKVNDDFSMVIRGERVKFELTEQKVKTPHVLTKDELGQLERYEKEKSRSLYFSSCEPRFRKYDYLPSGHLTFSTWQHGFVRDSTSNIIENRVGEMLLKLYEESNYVRIEREAKEAEQRAKEEEERREEERRNAYNEEVDRLQALLNESSDYEVARRIRGYVAAVEFKEGLDSDKEAWIKWAKAKADWFDPNVSSIDPVFGTLNHKESLKDKMPSKKETRHWW